jgi:iron complex outermembrane receptor protein
MLNFNLSKSFNLTGSSQLNVTLFGKNLTDEVARNHSSFVKDQAPLPARNYGIKLNLKI